MQQFTAKTFKGDQSTEAKVSWKNDLVSIVAAANDFKAVPRAAAAAAQASASASVQAPVLATAAIERQFYDVGYGSQTKMIKNTKGSLLTLPMNNR